MARLRVGVVGTGGIARNRHIPGYVKLKDEVDVVAICDVSKDVVTRTASEFGIEKAYTDYREMFDCEKLDAISVCTPNSFHAPISIAALERGIHVLCEKPLALCPEEAKNMIRAAEQAGKTLMTGFHYRFQAESQAAKRVIESGELGDIYMVRVQAIRRRGIPGWGVFTNRSLQGGGAMIDFGVHLLDLALWLAGNPKVVEVTGVTSAHLGSKPNVNPWGPWDHEHFEVEDHAAAFIRFENGMAMQFEASWALNVAQSAENVSFSGTHAGLDVFPFQLNKAAHGMLLNTKPAWMPGEQDNVGDLEIAEFIHSILEERTPLVTAQQALQVTEIVDAMYRSAEQRASIQLA
jgi:predicted dehydrogenase